ncbi:MAG TPA: TIGR00266 family protein [bacterium]|nr:TIGR00266 family protein [bacterium]
MQVKIAYQPSYALALVGLAANESVIAESGAMVSMTSNIAIQTSGRAATGGGGILKALKRSMLGGESFFMNSFTAQGGPGEVTFAPTLPGDIISLPLAGPSIIIQRSSYLASSPTVAIDTSWQGFKGFFGGESMFMLKASGQGEVLVNSFGAIHEIPLAGPYIVDTGHIVAFDETLTFQVKKVGSWKATFFSGEGLVTVFNGRGRLWIQSRNPSAFGHTIGGKLPPRRG